MRKVFILIGIVLAAAPAFAQFDTGKLQLRFGYNLHNAHAKHFNHLITTFNNERYPHIISENLSSVNFQRGYVFGGTYAFNENIYFHAIFKSRRQLISAQYNDPAFYRKYLFRASTLEAGVTIPVSDEGRFQHLVGGGLVLGVQSAYTSWTPESGNQSGRNMLNIAHSEIIGLSISYEAQILLHDNLRIFIRPVAQYAIPSNLRNLNQFFNPQVQEGEITYPEGEGSAYDKGSLNGIGIEGGLLIVLPSL